MAEVLLIYNYYVVEVNRTQFTFEASLINMYGLKTSY